jgi:hypothetical protein
MKVFLFASIINIQYLGNYSEHITSKRFKKLIPPIQVSLQWSSRKMSS